MAETAPEKKLSEEIRKIIDGLNAGDKDLTPEQVRAGILRVHNAVIIAAISVPQATQAIKALELYARVSGMMVQEQAAERKSAKPSFEAG